MAKNLEDIDFDNLSKEDEAYIRNTGSPDLMRRAGLMEPVTFDLTHVPGSMQPHEVDGEGEPVFDMEGKVAEQSVGGDPAKDEVLQPSPEPTKVDPVPFEGSTAQKQGEEPQPDPKADTAKTDGQKPAAKKTASPASTSKTSAS